MTNERYSVPVYSVQPDLQHTACTLQHMYLSMQVFLLHPSQITGLDTPRLYKDPPRILEIYIYIYTYTAPNRDTYSKEYVVHIASSYTSYCADKRDKMTTPVNKTDDVVYKK